MIGRLHFAWIMRTRHRSRESLSTSSIASFRWGLRFWIRSLFWTLLQNDEEGTCDEIGRCHRRVHRHWLGLRQGCSSRRIPRLRQRAQTGGRRPAAKEFGANFTPLIFDVTDEAAVAAGAKQVEAALGGETLFGLVNNAGIAVPGPLLYLKIEDFKRQIDVNLTGQLVVTQAFAPLLGADRSRKGAPGRIVMISSVGGRNALPFVGAYNASKFGLEGMSESLRRELMIFGVDVIIVAPGTVATPIWDKADAVDAAPFANTPLRACTRPAEAQHGLQAARTACRRRRSAKRSSPRSPSPRPNTRYTLTPIRSRT